MRFLGKVSIPTGAGNQMVKQPDFPEVMKGIVAELKPEAPYYPALEGRFRAWERRPAPRTGARPDESGPCALSAL